MTGKMGRAVQTRGQLAKWGLDDWHRGVGNDPCPPGTAPCEKKFPLVDQCR